MIAAHKGNLVLFNFVVEGLKEYNIISLDWKEYNLNVKEREREEVLVVGKAFNYCLLFIHELVRCRMEFFPSSAFSVGNIE